MEKVTMLASGYEWGCPKCEALNTEIEYTETVVCADCETTYETEPPEHALG